MKGFFELLGFASTALISGFLVFSYVGHKKNADKPAMNEMKTAYNSSASASLPQLRQVSSSSSISKEKKTAQQDVSTNYAAEKKTLAVESASTADKLKNLYADEKFVTAVAKKWKNQVSEAGETHSVKPHLLLSNVIVKSYLGSYSTADFKRDVSEHAGDLVLPTSTALKSYDYAWSVGKVAEQYKLTQYFPAEIPTAAAKVSYKAPATKKTTAASQQKAKPASISPAEAGFREMVAKEEGFTSWQGLQRLGDLDTKKNAEYRVKMLMSASRVR